MGVNKNISKEDLENCIQIHKTIFEICKKLNVSKVTLIKYMKLHDIKTPKGFYKTGAKLGCPKGHKQTKNHIEKRLAQFKKNGTPFKGCKHTDETRAKMSQNHADFTGDKNPFRRSLEENPENRKKISDRRIKWWANLSNEKRKEVLSNFSKAQINQPHHHNPGNRNYKYGHIETIKAGRIFIRSSWERWVAEQLDKLELVKTFEFEKLHIEYFYEDIKKYTKCDFVIELITGLKILMEIKPKEIQKIKNNPEKILTYQKYCGINGWKFILVDEDIIFDEEKFKEAIVSYVN